LKETIINLLKKIFLLHNQYSELIDARSFNVSPVSHLVKAELLDKNFSFSFQKNFRHIYMCFTKKKIFKHDKQKGLIEFFV